MSKVVGNYREVIVLGRGRSGTSLTAQLLHRMGIHMGKNFKEPSGWNRWGYWENEDFLHFNIEAIKRYKIDFPFDIPDIGVQNRKVYKKWRDRAKEIVEKNRRDFMWGWKDERNLHTLHLYYEFLEQPCFIVCTREKEQHIDSSMRVHGLNYEDADQAIDLYYEYVSRFLRNYGPVHYVHYDNLMGPKYDTEMKALADFLGIKIDRKELHKYVKAR